MQALRDLKSTSPLVRRGQGASERLTTMLIALLLLTAQLLWPLTVLARPDAAQALTPIDHSELLVVTGGCLSNCSGDDGSADEEDNDPTKTGSAYWEYAYRSLISRPAVAGDLIWQRVNDTDGYWGPFEVSYVHREKFNWSVNASVPSSTVQAQLGAAYEVARTLTEQFTIPPRTYYKFFVAYPYERWRYYYRKYQDYSDGSRKVVDSGDATVYDQWTKTTLVQGSVY